MTTTQTSQQITQKDYTTNKRVCQRFYSTDNMDLRLLPCFCIQFKRRSESV